MDRKTKERVRKMLKTTQGKWRAVHKQTGEVKYGRWNVLCDLEKRVWHLSEVVDEQVYMSGCLPAVKRLMKEQRLDERPGMIWVDCVVDMGEIDEHTGKFVHDLEFYQQGIWHWSELSGFYLGGV